jgi:hypothetical protein
MYRPSSMLMKCPTMSPRFGATETWGVVVPEGTNRGMALNAVGARTPS